jgi:hypothetical protein
MLITGLYAVISGLVLECSNKTNMSSEEKRNYLSYANVRCVTLLLRKQRVSHHVLSTSMCHSHTILQQCHYSAAQLRPPPMRLLLSPSLRDFPHLLPCCLLGSPHASALIPPLARKTYIPACTSWRGAEGGGAPSACPRANQQLHGGEGGTWKSECVHVWVGNCNFSSGLVRVRVILTLTLIWSASRAQLRSAMFCFFSTHQPSPTAHAPAWFSFRRHECVHIQ